MYPVRMFFEKSGLAIYISHLDLMRCFERSLRRADVPFWFTEGFNPRPFLTFALPLSLGYVGLHESVDIKMTEEYPLDKLVERMNQCLPTGLRVISAAEPVHKAKDIAYSRYHISFGFDCADALNERLSAESIIAEKTNKKKQRVEVDIKQYVKEYSVTNDGDGTVLDIALASGCTDNCNPSLVFEPLLASLGKEETVPEVVRTDVLLADMSAFA